MGKVKITKHFSAIIKAGEELGFFAEIIADRVESIEQAIDACLCVSAENRTDWFKNLWETADNKIVIKNDYLIAMRAINNGVQ